MLAAVVFGQKANPIVPKKVTFAPEDSADRKVYVPPVPACTVIFYPVIREQTRMGKGDKSRLIYRFKAKDDTAYTTLWQWDYKLTNGDSVTEMIKANLVP